LLLGAKFLSTISPHKPFQTSYRKKTLPLAISFSVALQLYISSHITVALSKFLFSWKFLFITPSSYTTMAETSQDSFKSATSDGSGSSTTKKLQQSKPDQDDLNDFSLLSVADDDGEQSEEILCPGTPEASPARSNSSKVSTCFIYLFYPISIIYIIYILYNSFFFFTRNIHVVISTHPLKWTRLTTWI
jgi:hypothetical protein